MDAQERDRQVRSAAFTFLVEQTALRGDVFSRADLSSGFLFDGQRVSFLGPQGIFKPAVIPTGIPLSITTAPPVEGKAPPYADGVGEDFLAYRYRGTDIQHHENVGLRKAMAERVPMNMRALQLDGADLGRGEDAHLVVDDQHTEGPLPGARDLGRLQQRLDEHPAGVVPNEPSEPATPSTGFDSSFDTSQARSPSHLPFTVLTVLFRPLPVEAHNVPQLLASLEGLLLLGIFLGSLRRVASSVRWARASPYVVVAVVYTIVFIYLFSSVGTNGTQSCS